MSFDLSYSPLFEVTIYHNFFLNDGESIYGNMSAEDKQKMIRKYDFQNFITISPSIATAALLRNYKMQFKKTKIGFIIFVKVNPSEKNNPFIKIPHDLELIFTAKVNDSQFENYTNLPFSQSRLFYFSNANPLRIEHNKPVPTPNLKKEVFDSATFNYIPVLSNNTLISDKFLATTEESNNLLPDFENTEVQGLFGAICIAMKGFNTATSVLTNQNKIMATARSFKIHFDNRKTFWKYINRRNTTEIQTKTAKPLTLSGFVEIDPLTDFAPAEPADRQYPNPSIKSIVKINNDYYSEIFI